MFVTRYDSPLGGIMLASDGDSLVGLWLEGQKYFAATLPQETEEKADLPVFVATRRWLDAYFEGERPDIADLPLAPKGGAFRRAVWDILCQIPYGEVISYGDIAKRIAARTGKASMSAQAVGGAVGHNPISIVIPCHRVVGADGSLTGYAGGIGKKITLLQLEGVDLSRLRTPARGTAL
ncbi:methylated-DNA--[protein]-cysteine S-methyltransferase [Geomonas propionica]|uniref:Methylated-DNA--protein-cysteine methyltransferase n=1 Tax=Geomonas propionica TaxID=2798582 RepID=A0ABS0YRM9_9BACT|nr:methylated-DNA--[protein]-cysteine S-methyltransferase [Geomonas propionica]MBJ6800571.1 methylated-DNA--[protein]-cysteine S-methyltransferase [Geomonas propionica]